MQKLIIAVLLSLVAGPALAHHPLAGMPMTTFAHGLLSGFGHPILGFDHLFFVISVGIIAIFTRHRILAPLAYIIAMLGGCLVSALWTSIPATELMIAAIATGAWFNAAQRTSLQPVDHSGCLCRFRIISWCGLWRISCGAGSHLRYPGVGGLPAGPRRNPVCNCSGRGPGLHDAIECFSGKRNSAPPGRCDGRRGRALPDARTFRRPAVTGHFQLGLLPGFKLDRLPVRRRQVGLLPVLAFTGHCLLIDFTVAGDQPFERV